jgi:hypothetical protein
MSRSRCWHWGLLIGSVLAGAIGCQPAGPVLVPVTGRIMMNGKPVSEFIVTFAPIGETLGSGSIGFTDKEGNFTLDDVRGKPGAHVGQYKIHLYPAPAPRPDGVPSDVVSLGGGGVPGIYIDPNATPLVVLVPPSGCSVAVTLTATGEGASAVSTPTAK